MYVVQCAALTGKKKDRNNMVGAVPMAQSIIQIKRMSIENKGNAFRIRNKEKESGEERGGGCRKVNSTTSIPGTEEKKTKIATAMDLFRDNDCGRPTFFHPVMALIHSNLPLIQRFCSFKDSVYGWKVLGRSRKPCRQTKEFQ